MATPRVVMQAFVSGLVCVLLFTTPAAASSHEVKLRVLTTLSQNVRGVGISPGAEGPLSSPIPCSPPYPDNTVIVQQKVPGYVSAEQCSLALPSHDVTGTVHNREVQAFLTTEEGMQYYVILGCQKQYGWCDPVTDKANYSGRLNDNPKWLADYQHRPVTSFMKISFRPTGKKKVTYAIEYAAKVILVNAPTTGTKPDPAQPRSFATSLAK